MAKLNLLRPSKTTHTIAVLLSVFITMPIWFYILYKLLEATQASELTWFLFWIYLPVAFFVTAIVKLYESPNKDGSNKW